MWLKPKLLTLVVMPILFGTAFCFFFFWPRESIQSQETKPPEASPLANTPDDMLPPSSPNANSRRLPAVAAVPSNPPPRKVASTPKLQDMSAREVLNFAIQLAKDGVLGNAAPALAPHFSRNWRETLSFEELHALVADPSSDVVLRSFLVDFMIHAADLTADETGLLSRTLITIAESSDTETGLRKYALMALRQSVSLDQTTRIKEISENATVPPEVRGAAITAMRRTGDEATHEAAVGAVIDTAATTEPELLRHAVVSSAKAGIASDRVGQFRDIAMTTESSDVYASTIYALGLVGTQDAVVAILETSTRFENEHITRYALQSSQRAILQMLKAENSLPTVSAGIEAAHRGGLGAAKPSLSLLGDTHPDLAIRIKAKDALLSLPPDTNVKSKQQLKWED